MKYKEYHYRVNSIKKQIDKLRQINEEILEEILFKITGKTPSERCK